MRINPKFEWVEDAPATDTAGPPNPYREQAKNVSLADALEGAGHHDARCKGLDGEALDALLRGRMEEGRRIGQTDGRRAAESRYPDIWDEGWRTGQQRGVESERRAFLESLNLLFSELQGLVEGINSKARGEWMKAQLGSLQSRLAEERASVLARLDEPS